MQLTKDELDATLRYEPDTGVFYNIRDRGARARAGTPAGTLASTGYIRINIKGQLHLAHRLAWLTTYGAHPQQVVDHINGNRADNRMANLRDVSHAENLQNQFRPTRDNPYLGVSLVRGKWQSVVMRFGLSIHLGMFATAEEASRAYQSTKTLTHEEFRALARSMRRRNKLAAELTEVLQSFPGFSSSSAQKEAWAARRLIALS